MDESMRHLTAMSEAAKAVAEYKTSELSQHLEQMLSALADSYRADLADVSEPGLRTLQAHLKQTLAIRAVIRGEIELPRV